jgi:thymidylate synthase ThyX
MSRIILHTELNAEDNAMLQALYSRSSASVTDHIEKLQKVGSSKFMSQFYLGYGHASIGDCGTETLYFEGISMLAAKAIEDNPLFVGQECSSRYIDFSNQPFYNPYILETDNVLTGSLYGLYRNFYVSSLEPLKADLRKRLPIGPDDKETIYEKAIAARAFDILRGFLPAGATTNVAWTARLSNAAEHLIWMMHHPLEEVRELGVEAYRALYMKYPNSFKKEYCGHEAFSTSELLYELEGKEVFEYTSNISNFYAGGTFETFEYVMARSSMLEPDIDIDERISHLKSLNRPRKTKLPKHLQASQYPISITALLDFGAFRDIQRHRNGYCSMPMLNGYSGLHPWYIDNLPEELKNKAITLLTQVGEIYMRLVKENSRTGYSEIQRVAEAQYILPMGTTVLIYLKYSLQQAIYVAELRSSKTVHATLRPLAQAIGEKLGEYDVPVFYDKDESDWTIKRGEQDIVSVKQST